MPFRFEQVRPAFEVEQAVDFLSARTQPDSGCHALRLKCGRQELFERVTALTPLLRRRIVRKQKFVK